MPTELASSVEIIRGPGNALYGSNALHGTINILMPHPDAGDVEYASVDIGPNEFLRVDEKLSVMPTLNAFHCSGHDRDKNTTWTFDKITVSGGRSRHKGLEASVNVQLHEYWSLAINGTYARHLYDFDVGAARGETFMSGRDIDTAPRWQGSASLSWVSLGPYYLDAANEHTYPGHDIANLRLRFPLSDRLSVTAR